jgi:hypothetical protein
MASSIGFIYNKYKYHSIFSNEEENEHDSAVCRKTDIRQLWHILKGMYPHHHTHINIFQNFITVTAVLAYN